MYDEHGNLGLRFPSEAGHTYKLSASEDLVTWNHLVSLRDPAQVDWPLRESESTRERMFFRTQKVVATGLENLTGWQAFQSADYGGRFHIGLIGDSFTHARDRYAKRLKQTLTGEYGNLGAGYLGFAFVTGAGNNGSVDETELNYVINPSEWTVTYGNGYGADACHVTSAVTGARIDVRVLKRVDEMKIHYAHQPGTGGFRYRVKEGDWTIVITDAPLGLGIESLDLASQDAPYDVEIEAVAGGVALLGVEAIIAGDGVVCHKLGATGRRAIHFATNETAKDAINELDLDMALIMFGTNEQQASQGPTSFGNALRNIISSLRNYNPDIDIVLMLPCYTKFELEQPRTHKLQEYGDVMREVAVECAAAFMDFTEVFGPPQELQNSIDQGLMRHDRVHPSITGAGSGGWLIADTISKSILSVD